LAQRLVRSFCPGGGKPVKIDPAIRMIFEKQLEDLPASHRKEIPFGNEIYEITPVPNYPSGISGRVAVVEALEIDKELEQIILKSPTEQEIWKYTRSKGMLTMKDDAIIKIFNRVIPFEEYNTL